MNYQKIYDQIIDRAKHRKLEGYKEKHHIIPKCMGGKNTKDNLVELTPEEHYVCHQLLVKMYPKHHGLVNAANQMTSGSNNHQRNNKLYGWLRRKLSDTMSKSQTGKNNSQFGKFWITNNIENKKINTNDKIPDGWMKGRIFIKDKKRNCDVCNRIYYYTFENSKYCSHACQGINITKNIIQNKKSISNKIYNTEFKVTDQLLECAKSKSGIGKCLEILGKSKHAKYSFESNFIRNYREENDIYFGRKVPREKLIELAESSMSYSECMRILGKSVSSWCKDRVFIKEYREGKIK